MKVIEMSFKEILGDFFFCFTSESDHANLKRSIQESGILSPLQVMPTKKKYQLLSGFKRFQIAQELKLSHVPVTIKPESVSVEKAFRCVLLEQAIYRTFNLVEKSKILRILENLEVSFELMKTDFLPILEIPEQLHMVDEIKNLLKLSQPTQHYIEIYNLSLKQTKIFNQLIHDEQDRLVGMAMELQIRSVELSEMISMLLDISGREALSIEEVLNRLNIDQILENQDLSKPEKLFKIKEHLMDMRYPKLASWNRSISNLCKAIHLPRQIQLKWDRSLEKPGVELLAKIQTTEDVKCIDRILSNKENMDRFEEILKIV